MTGRTGSCADREAGERLAAYELGLLDETERTGFEAHLDRCAACLEELYQSAPAAVGARLHPAAILAALAAAERLRPAPSGSFRSRLRERLTFTSWRPLVPITGLAVVLVMIGIRMMPDRAPTFGSLATVEPIPYTAMDVRGLEGKGEALTRFREAMQLYAKGDYREAAERLGRVAAEDSAALPAPVRDETMLFRGVSLLLDGKTSEAIPSLEAASRSAIFPVADRARWYLAQARLVAGEIDAAVHLLEIVAGESPAYGERARAQLDEIAAVRGEREGNQR